MKGIDCSYYYEGYTTFKTEDLQNLKGKNMTANYHTHTFRCRHASSEDEREYVESAIAAGYTELGFSDHTPMPLPNGIDPADCERFMGMRMTMQETEDYVNKLLQLREQYKNDIKIHIGFEVEYIPEVFDGLMDFLGGFPTDYIIMGQHFNTVLNDKMTYFGAETRSRQVLTEYADLVCEGIKTGKFTYVAHPDLCNFHGLLKVYEREMRRIIETAKENSVPLEINLLGIDTVRNYPNNVFWSLASDIGCDVIIGSDAHEASCVKPERALYYAEKIVERNNGLHLLDTVSLRSIR